MDAPDVSILVCTYNRAPQLGRVLDTLARQQVDGYRCEILIVDDGSTDQTRQVVQKAATESPVPVRYVSEKGVGVAAARNRCLREAHSTWLAFFDDDQLAEPDWLAALLACAQEHKALYVGGQRVLHLEPEVLETLSPTSRAVLGELLWGACPRAARRKEVPAMGSVLIHRSVFDSIGGFDESLVRGGEDGDLFQRARAAQIVVWNTPASVCRHLIPAYRLKERYLRWVSQRIGQSFAYRDSRQWGAARRFAACAARVGRTLLVNMPLLCCARLTGDRRTAVEHRCLTARTAGYLRQYLSVTAPKLFPQERFLTRFEFRSEREIFQPASCMNDVPR